MNTKLVFELENGSAGHLLSDGFLFFGVEVAWINDLDQGKVYTLPVSDIVRLQEEKPIRNVTERDWVYSWVIEATVKSEVQALWEKLGEEGYFGD